MPSAHWVEVLNIQVRHNDRMAHFLEHPDRCITHRAIERLRFFMGVNDQYIHRIELPFVTQLLEKREQKSP